MRTNLIKPKNISEAKSKTSNDGMLDMVIAFDTTGSMASCIRSVKEYVTELVPKLFAVNPNLKLGVVAFGDYCDMESQHEFGKAYQVLDLTYDGHEIIEFISKAENTYGGDGSEFYELVIKKITEETSWREGSVKSVLLIADATPHEVGYSYGDRVRNNKIDWRAEAKKAAEKGIKFDTLSIGDSRWFTELSEMTNGVHSPFSTDSKTSQLVEVAALSRGGENAKALYKANYQKFVEEGDMEMVDVYLAYSKEVLY